MITVAVLRGGPSNEHEVSLKSGANVLSHLQREPYKAVDVFIDKKGVWHVRGVPMDPKRALSSVDVVFNVLHGQYGEDGTVQRILDRMSIPYTGAGALPATLSMNKKLTKEVLAPTGMKLAHSAILKVSPDLNKEILELFRTFPQPSVIKPNTSGSSVGVTVARNFEDFKEGIKKAFAYSTQVLIEEYIKGREATVGIVEGLRGKKYYDLVPVEILLPPNANFFDYEVKYSGQMTERVPGNFTRAETEELQRLAGLVHEKIGLRHYSRSDFIVSPRGIYFLEVNSAAGVELTGGSLLSKALKAVGVEMDEFIDHVIKETLKK